MNSTVAILEQIVELFKQTNNNSSVTNKLDLLINQTTKIQEQLKNGNDKSENTSHKENGTDDPTEDEEFLALAANISTSIARNKSGVIDISRHPALTGNVINIQIQANSLKSETTLPNNVTSFENIPPEIGNLNITPAIASSSPAGYAVIYNSSSIGLDGTAAPNPGIKLYSLKFTATYAEGGRWDSRKNEATPTKTIYLLVSVSAN